MVVSTDGPKGKREEEEEEEEEGMRWCMFVGSARFAYDHVTHYGWLLPCSGIMR